MLNSKIIFNNRLRDVSAIFSSSFKFRAFLFVFLRTFLRPLSINESFINLIIPDGLSKFYNFVLYTRKHTLDFLFASVFYEPQTTNFLFTHNFRTIYIFGGHIGRFALLASLISKKVIVLEPDHDNFRLLQINLLINNISNVVALNYAIGVDHREVSMESDLNTLNNTGKKFVSNVIEGRPKVTQVTPKYIFDAHPPCDVALVLIDIEGFEEALLSRCYNDFIGKHILVESFNVLHLKELFSSHSLVLSYDSVNHYFRPH